MNVNHVENTQVKIVASHDVIIIGSGFSGIGAGIRLTQEGLNDFNIPVASVMYLRLCIHTHSHRIRIGARYSLDKKKF
jgi:cation diffusion facilitator CzcD-associated flavoprotein CzcO